MKRQSSVDLAHEAGAQGTQMQNCRWYKTLQKAVVGTNSQVNPERARIILSNSQEPGERERACYVPIHEQDLRSDFSLNKGSGRRQADQKN